MARKYLVYALIDPRDKTVFYIGKTKRSPSLRLEEHLQDFEGMSPKQERIKAIYDSNAGEPDLVVLEKDIESDKSAFTREIFWIELFSMKGAQLTNASVDYDGVYFLADYHLNSVGDSTGNSHDDGSQDSRDKKLSWKVDIKPTKRKGTDGFLEEEYYETEFGGTSNENSESARRDLDKKRAQNVAAGRLKNHGFPVTDDEIALLVERIRRGDSVRQVVEFFQRSESSIRSILRKKGFDVQFEYHQKQRN